MPRRQRYSSYDPRIKALISKTGKVDLFPELKIPRTTALYWIEKNYAIDDPLLDSLAQNIADCTENEKALSKLVSEIQSVQSLLKSVLEVLGFKLNYTHIDSKETRNRILDLIATAMKNARRKKCLQALDLSLSRFKRWRRERRGCGIIDIKACPKYNLNQLTFQEVKIMGDLVTSVEYSHFPIRSLHYYAKREKILYCSYSTWTKYIDDYGWKRPRKKKRKKYERIGIRAKKPNAIWHMDLSYFVFPDGRKAFIQVVIDNYSRYVLAWQILDSFDGAKTATLLERALERSSGKKLSLIVDGGSENKGPGVNKLIADGLLIKKIAQFEISYSNSIVEALFRSMKHNYLYHQKIESLKSLKQHTDFWFKEHNEKIPHTAFSGETPLERFKQSWSKDEEIKIRVKHEEALQLRIKNNQMIYCKLCDVA